MMNERVGDLTTYLKVLIDAQSSGYKCNGEIAEVIRELRHETGIVNAEDKAGVYQRKLVEICGDNYSKDYRFANALIYNAYLSGISGEMYVSRATGTTTSLKALAEAFDDVVYTDERGRFTNDNLNDKVVFLERSKSVPTGSRPKCVINIRWIDFIDFNRARIF